MNPNAVFSASLVGSLVLWFPSMQACLRGDLDLTPAGLRYLAALTVSRLAMGFLARLVDAYRAQRPQPPGEGSPQGTAPNAEPAGAPHRRRTDQSGGGDADPASLAA